MMSNQDQDSILSSGAVFQQGICKVQLPINVFPFPLCLTCIHCEVCNKLLSEDKMIIVTETDSAGALSKCMTVALSEEVNYLL